jgi:hypothetical protein
MTTVNMASAPTGVVTSKGTKGLLLWIQQAMPDFYAELSPKLVAMAKANPQPKTGTVKSPKVGSLSCGMQAQLRDLYMGSFRGRSGLGDVTAYDSPVVDYASYLSSPIDTSISLSNPGFTDLTVAPSSSTTNAATVATTAPTSPSLANAISSIANAVSVGTLASAQVSANNTLLQTNLARAQQGLPPLTTTTSANGLVTLGSSSSLLLLGLGVLLLIGMSKDSKASA